MLLKQILRGALPLQRVKNGPLTTFVCPNRTVVGPVAQDQASSTLMKTRTSHASGTAVESKALTLLTSVFRARAHYNDYNRTSSRKFSSNSDIPPEQPYQVLSSDVSIEVDFDKLVSLIETGNIQLFDVRQPEELQVTGRMPGAVNIPLGEIGEAFDLTPGTFKEKYGAKKPEKTDSDIVLTCLGGIRSKRALDAVVEKGYTKARHYPGGLEEWIVRQGLAPPS